MTPKTLHQLAKQSVHIISSRNSRGFRRLLESGGSESFLRDLLFMELTSAGNTVIREFPIPQRKGYAAPSTAAEKRRSVDLVLPDVNTYIELKQLHLKDGPRWVPNVVNDLRCHECRCFGMVYVLDERSSCTELPFWRYNKANRRTRFSVRDIINGLQAAFPSVFPQDEEQALLRRFRGEGHVDLYAFAVSLGSAKRALTQL